METRIQFRIDEETKRLAQQRAESQGRTLSDACRELTEELAAEQRAALSHDEWLNRQVTEAFDRLDTGRSHFTDHDTAKKMMAHRKARIRSESESESESE